VGAVTDDGASVTVRMSVPASDVQLRVGSTTTSAVVTDADRCVRLDIDGLAADTAYTYEVLSGGLVHATGRFRTLPAAGAAASFTIAFSGDAETGSTSPVFSAIEASDPLMFVHLGDLHYQNIATNTPALFHSAYDRVLASRPQASLYCNVPTAYVWDDHDYGPNNADGSSVTKPAAASVYRQRVPYYALPHATAVYQTWDIGNVRFIVTDQRSEASSESDTDNSSKTMLGATQKAWFKGLLSNSSGMLIVWICPRWFGKGATGSGDSWGRFTTERRELADHIKANCHGRVIVLSADLHTLGIDDGAGHDFATGGGEPLPTFQAAALDQEPITGTDATYSEGGQFLGRGQWGSMQIVDSGSSSIGVTWTGHASTGAVLTSYSFSVNV
jgi:phosphodiesterase/alkaline phosphatase D-like protein